MTHLDILDAVDALTTPVRTALIRDDGSMIRAEQEPLLVQLEDAIRGSGVGIGGSGALASERNIINGVALFEFQQIRASIIRWRQELSLSPTDSLVDGLRGWHAAWIATQDAAEFRLSELRRWAKTIRTLLDPPRQQDLPEPCPACDAGTWFDAQTVEERLRPLVILYRNDEHPDKATAKCRACECTWGARELAYELEVRDMTSKPT